MGKPLSRPGCLQRSPCCSRKGEDGEGYNEDGYIPQRSIYDTMCINEHIDQGSAHSTLGSRGGQDANLSRNGSLAASVGDVFESRSSVLMVSGRKLDERFIFDSLKLAHDEQSRSPGLFVKSVSPSVSCSSAPGGSASMTKRHHHQDSSKKDNLCRHSWKVLTPPKYPEALEFPSGEKHLLNPGTVFFPSSITSPQISPFSGSPLSSGGHTPPVFFSPTEPFPYHQQFHRQTLPAQPTAQRPPLSELSVCGLMSGLDAPIKTERGEVTRTGEVANEREKIFRSLKTKPVGLGHFPDSSTQEPDNDRVPLLHSQTSQAPMLAHSVVESTWPRRLIGRRRTVRQDGAIHNLPILPPLPSLLMRSVTEKKPQLSPFPEHQGAVEGKLGRSNLAGELKDCSMQDWKLLRDLEQHSPGSSQNEAAKEPVVKNEDRIASVNEEIVQTTEDTGSSDNEEENWEAVLKMVNSLWDDTWGESDSQNVGSLRRWPLLQPPTGFGGSQAPSGTSSELGAEDLIELQKMSKEASEITKVTNVTDQFQSSQGSGKDKQNVVVKQPKGLNSKSPESHTRIPTSLDLISVETQMSNKYGHGGSPDSNLTLDSDSSGVYMSNPSHTSREDIASDSDKPMSDLDLGSATSLDQGEEDEEMVLRTGTCISGEITQSQHGGNNLPGLSTYKRGPDKQLNNKSIKTSHTMKQDDSKPVDREHINQEIDSTVNTAMTDLPLPLSPSKHKVRETLLDSCDMDPFVATDSFVYLAVSVPTPTQAGVSTSVPKEPSPPNPFTKPSTYPDECDFLSTDSFVYLAAPDCHLFTEGHSMYAASKDSDSEDSDSRADFVLASTVGDSDWDSDLSDSEPEPDSSKPEWDHWAELEQGVLQMLFSDNQSETGFMQDDPCKQISRQLGELAASAVVAQDSIELGASAT